MRWYSALRRMWADEGGATAIEYGLIIGMMSLVIIGIAASGGALETMYEKVRLLITAMGGGSDDDG